MNTYEEIPLIQSKAGKWDNMENQKMYMNWLGKHLGFITIDCWYKLTGEMVRKNKGIALIKRHYNNSVIQLLKGVFPEHTFHEWKFCRTSVGFWQDIENQRDYMDWLGDILKYKKKEDWYQFDKHKIINNYGAGLFSKYYNGSPIQLLKAVYPESEWLPWRFDGAPHVIWNEKSNQIAYMNWLGNILGISQPDDWYRVTCYAIRKNYGGTLLDTYYNSSPIQLLRAVFDEIEWALTVSRNSDKY